MFDFTDKKNYNTGRDKKRITVISFTEQGSRRNAELAQLLPKAGYDCENYTIKRSAAKYGLRPVDDDLKGWIAAQWGSRAFLFIGAAGIAVRMSAPCIRDKYSDPAVLVMDEQARFVIPLLSGHLGGAVQIARDIAECTGAVPVITTATDIEEKFAVDMFAAQNQLVITDRRAAKEISAAVLEGKKVGLFSPYPLRGGAPPEVCPCREREGLAAYEYGIEIPPVRKAGEKSEIKEEKTKILRLLPRDLAVGIGCRKGISTEKLREELTGVFCQNGWEPERIFAFSSIDLKKEEKAILELAGRWNVSFFTYPAEELNEISEVSGRSDFVRTVTGIDNVCERAARRCCPEGALLLPKTKLDQVTVSVVQRKTTLSF